MTNAPCRTGKVQYDEAGAAAALALQPQMACYYPCKFCNCYHLSRQTRHDPRLHPLLRRAMQAGTAESDGFTRDNRPLYEHTIGDMRYRFAYNPQTHAVAIVAKLPPLEQALRALILANASHQLPTLDAVATYHEVVYEGKVYWCTYFKRYKSVAVISTVLTVTHEGLAHEFALGKGVDLNGRRLSFHHHFATPTFVLCADADPISSFVLEPPQRPALTIERRKGTPRL